MNVQRTVALVLCDNDFSQVLINLLHSVHDVIMYRNGECSLAYVEDLVYRGIEFHVQGYQPHIDTVTENRFKYACHYLQTNLVVLFDAEAEAHIEKHDHNRGSGYLELATGNVYTY